MAEISATGMGLAHELHCITGRQTTRRSKRGVGVPGQSVDMEAISGNKKRPVPELQAWSNTDVAWQQVSGTILW